VLFLLLDVLFRVDWPRVNRERVSWNTSSLFFVEKETL